MASRKQVAGKSNWVPENYRDASFDNFYLPHDNPIVSKELARAMVIVKGYANNFPVHPSKPGLLLVGPPGAGKTHLAVAALRQIRGCGHQGLFLNERVLIDRFFRTEKAYKDALAIELLVLEGLGSHVYDSVCEETIGSLISFRRKHQKPLIATTTFPELDIGANARTELLEMCTIVSLWGVPDYRTRQPRHSNVYTWEEALHAHQRRQAGPFPARRCG